MKFQKTGGDSGSGLRNDDVLDTFGKMLSCWRDKPPPHAERVADDGF